MPGAEIARELEELHRRAGVRADFVLHPLDPTLSGAAFGTVRRRYVQLNRGLLVLRATDRARCVAVVLHGLAYLRNRDLGSPRGSPCGTSDVRRTPVGLFRA